jgi:ribosomal protein L5
MTKVLFHNSLEKINLLAMRALEAIEDGELLKKHLETIRKLTFPPPVNTVALRRNIADAMIRYGRYNF